MLKRRSRTFLVAVSGALLLGQVLVACGDSKESSGAEGGENDCSNAEVMEAVDGMDQDERTETLLQLAEDNEEENSLTIYSSMSVEDLEIIIEPFKERYGTDIGIADLDSSEIVQRVATEADANKTQADIIQLGGQDQQLAAEQDLLAPVDTPYAEGIPDELVYDYFIADYVVGYVLLWNNELMTADTVPTTYEELAEAEMGEELGVPTGKWDYAATLAMYLQEKNDWTEEEAIDLMTKMFAGVKVYDDEAPLAEAVHLGEVSAGIDYDDYYQEYRDNGSTTMEWEPAIDPVIVRPSGASMTCTTSKPARATMLADYLISEESQLRIVESGRTPSNTNVEGGVLSTGEHNPIYEDMELIANEEMATKWSDLWDEMTGVK